MRIKNIVPKPIGIGSYIIMPGETKDIPDEVAYINEYDKNGKKTGKKIILPAIVLLDGLHQIAYVETVMKSEDVEKAIEAENDEAENDEAKNDEVVEEKPKRGRRKAE